ncbi:MAG: hypothetical protein ACPL6C_02625 [bacterium]
MGRLKEDKQEFRNKCGCENISQEPFWGDIFLLSKRIFLKIRKKT